MAFCKFCGKEIPEGNVCDECKASQPVPEVTSGDTVGTDSPVPEGNADKKKNITVIAVAVVIVLLLIAIISSIAGGGYKDPIKDMIKGFNKADSERLLEAFYPTDYLKDMAEDEDLKLKDLYDELDDDLEDALDSLEDDYGKNVKISFDFEDKKKLSDKKISDYEDWYDDYLDLDVEIKKAYKVEGTMEIKGKENDDDEDVEFIVVKIKGEGWKVYPGSGDASFFDMF